MKIKKSLLNKYMLVQFVLYFVVLIALNFLVEITYNYESFLLYDMQGFMLFLPLLCTILVFMFQKEINAYTRHIVHRTQQYRRYYIKTILRYALIGATICLAG